MLQGKPKRNNSRHFVSNFRLQVVMLAIKG